MVNISGGRAGLSIYGGDVIMLWLTNILLGFIIFLLIIIFGGICNVDRKLEAIDKMLKLTKLFNDLTSKRGSILKGSVLKDLMGNKKEGG